MKSARLPPLLLLLLEYSVRCALQWPFYICSRGERAILSRVEKRYDSVAFKWAHIFLAARGDDEIPARRIESETYGACYRSIIIIIYTERFLS
jgi:hypothetical protein